MIDSILNIINKIIPDGDKRKQLETEIKNVINKELTERQKIDSQTDSFLTKNIRPITLLTLIILFVISTFFNVVEESKYKVISELLQWVVAFYFGSRGVEKLGNGKILGIFKRKKE